MRWIAVIFLALAACGTLPGLCRAEPAVSGPHGRGDAAPPWEDPALAQDGGAGGAAEKEPVLVRSATAAARAAEQSASTRQDAQVLDVGRIVSALAVVLALIFALRWIGKRLMAGTGGPRGSRAVQVLSRSVIAPRQQVLLIQVGRRVIVVGDTGQQMTPLAQIDDPDEIAALVAQVDPQSGPDALTRAFGSLFNRAGAKFEMARATPASTDADDPPDPEHADVPPAAGDPALAATQAELSGLADKIRLVSRQFRKT